MTQLLKFPCEFNLKVFGKAESNLETIVLPILTRYVDNLKEGSLSTKESKNNKFISITVSFQAKNKEQLDNIYREITKHPDVLMAL
ncbi:MAG: DUF493 domain-containing protein [Francisellaceae bacterium]|jgi:uncharacterized protein|nr:DUF493 domain-containing protein [Francisellaceae bacterium]MBT6539723.1 DUF493 domain-containing protein [Francisellaceae bacterium]